MYSGGRYAASKLNVTLVGVLSTRAPSTLLDSKSIEDMHLDVGFLRHPENPPLFSLGSIVTRRTWKNLSYLSWSEIPLHLRELEQFIERHETPNMCMWMKEMRLLSGTWADALDIFRKKPTRRLTFEEPLGAECEELSDEEQKAIFRKPHDAWYMSSRAEKYVKGCIDSNPLREDRETNDAD